MSFPNNNMMPTLGGGAGGGAGNNNSVRRGSHNLNHLSSWHHSAPAPTTTTHKANSNPTSVDAMFQGILPPGAMALSPSNPRQHLSGLHFGSTTCAAGNNAGGSGGSLLLGMGGGSLSGSNSRHVHQGADPSHLAVHHQQQQQQHQQQQQLTALRRNSELSEEIKRLQQLHQLTSASASASVGLSNDQLLQNYLAATSSSTNNNTTNASSRDAAATHLLMAQQLQKQQQQQQQALQKQQQQQQALQQQQQQQQVQALQQQLGMSSTTPGGGGASLVAQLMAAGAGGGAGTVNVSAFHSPLFRTHNNQTTTAYQSLLPSPSMLSARGSAMIGRPGPGAIEPFPEKLHRMLTEVELSGKSHIISFVDDGRAFAIHKPSHFFKEVVPLYFRQSRLSSFKRQLNLYGFELISNGPSRGAYFHELFQKDKPSLCRRMRRVAVKVGSKNSSKQQEDKEEKEEVPSEDAKKVEKEIPSERPSTNED